MKYISLFSGAMGLDLGLEEAGLDCAVCVEKDKLCCETIRLNRPGIPVIEEDITKVTTAQILEKAGLEVGQAFAVVGGPPCQSFSTGGNRGTIQDERGNLFYDFVRVVREAQPLFFVFENVAQILTAPVKHRPIAERPGQRWHLTSYQEDAGSADADEEALPLTADEHAGTALKVILDTFDELGYGLSFGVLDASRYGVPQKRFRFVLMGSRIVREVPLPQPTHSPDPEQDGLLPLVTLYDAIGDLQEEKPLYSRYTPAFERFFSLVPQGGNWRNLPKDIQKEALGEKAYVAGGGKTGFFRRLSWDAPAPTIIGKPNRKSSALCHPSEIRTLSVRECALVQGFPLDWQFAGGMHGQFLQVGNAVPVGLGAAVGHALLAAYEDYQQLPDPEAERRHMHDWRKKRETMLGDSSAVLKAAARNKRKAKPMEGLEPPHTLVKVRQDSSAVSLFD